MASVTVRSQAERIRRRLYGAALETYNVLRTGLDDSETTVAFEDEIIALSAGTPISIGTELMLTRADPDDTAKTVRVVRGFMGTTAATHDAGELIEIGPRFFLGDLVDTMQEEIRSWDDRLFRVETAPLTAGSADRGYDLTGASDPLFPLGVLVAEGSSSDNSRTGVPFIFLRDLDTNDFPSGFGIQLRRRPPTGAPLVVAWAERIVVDSWNLNTDLINQIGLEASWLDIITYGVMWRVMSGKEIIRTDMQAAGEIRRAEEVPPGHLAQTAAEYKKIRDARIATEARKLRGKYPYMKD